MLRRFGIRLPRRAAGLAGLGILASILAPAPASGANTVYVLNFSATVVPFSVVPNGTLTEQGDGAATSTSQFGGADAFALTPNGRYAYVADGSGNRIVEYAVGVDGTLSWLGAAAAGTGTNPWPDALAVSPGGGDLFVGGSDSGTVATFAIGAGGLLTPTGAAVVSGLCCDAGPAALALAPDGRYLYAANSGQGTVSTFTVTADGALTQVGTGAPTGSGDLGRPVALTVSATGRAVYTANYKAGTVSALALGAGGTLSAPGMPLTTGSGPGSGADGVAVSPDGADVYVANSGQGTISIFSVGSGGALTPAGSVLSGRGPHSYPTSVAVSPDGRHLYSGNGAGGSVSSFVIGGGGGLTQIGSGVRSASRSEVANPEAIVVSPDHPPTVGVTRTLTAGNQKLELSTPPQQICQGSGGDLEAALSSRSAAHGAALRFRGAGFYIDRGITSRRRVKRGGHKVILTTVRADATASRLPAHEQLSLAGLASGTHTLTVHLSFAAAHGPSAPSAVTLKAPFKVC